jgi:ABC-2 type transport system permease protein
MSIALDAPRGISNRIVSFFSQSAVVAEAELRKLRHDPYELATRAIQPALWLVIFGQVMARVRGIPTGSVSYLDFLTPGILAQSSLFVAIFYGISVIWERDLGVLVRFIVSPAARGALVLGKGLGAGIRGLTQGVIVFVLATLLGVHVQWALLPLIGVVFIILLGAAVFCSFSLIIASIVKTRDRFMGIGQVLTMPLFFASNAIYPMSLMPPWLRAIAFVNPLTYQVDALRSLMLGGAVSTVGIGLDFGVLLAALAILVTIAARIYPSILY